MNPVTMKAVLTKQSSRQPTSTREIQLKNNRPQQATTEEVKEAAFYAMDSNHDGKVSIDEFKAMNTNNDGDVEEVPLPSHNSHLGPRWDEFWHKKGRNGHDCSLVPQCDVKLQMNRVSDINEVRGTFDCIVVVMADWIDPSLERERPSLQKLGHKAPAPIWSHHFVPHFDIEGCVGAAEILGGGDGPPLPKLRQKDKKTGECNHCAMTVMYAVTIMVRFDFRYFPYEKQCLEILVKCASVSDGKKWERGADRAYVQLLNPHRWRGKKGHVLKDDADWMTDWIPREINGGPFSQHQAKRIEYDAEETDRSLKFKVNDCYKMQLIVERDATSITWNSVFSLFVVDFLSATGWGVPVTDLADRLGVVLTMLLTVMAFKYTLSDALPNVPYLTILDKFVVSSFIIIVCQGGMMWVLKEMETYNCSEEFEPGVATEHVNFWSRATPYNATAISSAELAAQEQFCQNIYLLDRMCMLVQSFTVVLKIVIFFALRPCGMLDSNEVSFVDGALAHTEIRHSEFSHEVEPRTYQMLNK